jgi:hypothetical protein
VGWSGHLLHEPWAPAHFLLPGFTNEILAAFRVVCYEIRTNQLSSRLPDQQTACSLSNMVSGLSFTGRGFGLF